MTNHLYYGDNLAVPATLADFTRPTHLHVGDCELGSGAVFREIFKV
ncbi:MAG: hypothetical protein R6U99_04940 [Nioella sp.]